MTEQQPIKIQETKCPKCGQERVRLTLLKDDGVIKHVQQCVACKMWNHLKCPLCQKDITTVKDECNISGFVEGYHFSHITCMFAPDNKYVMIASMLQDAFCKALAFEGMPEKAIPWWKLDPQTKDMAIANVKGMEEWFKRWDEGRSLADKILQEKVKLAKAAGKVKK